MPQEINKENVTEHVLNRIHGLVVGVSNLERAVKECRTDGERMHTNGLLFGRRLELSKWKSTAELFGIEINTEEDE